MRPRSRWVVVEEVGVVERKARMGEAGARFDLPLRRQVVSHLTEYGVGGLGRVVDDVDVGNARDHAGYADVKASPGRQIDRVALEVSARHPAQWPLVRRDDV